MLKNKIFIYFFLEFTKIFLVTTLSLSILIWMTQAARLLELITEFGNSISVYASFLFLSYPKILNNIYLLTYAISLFFLFAKFETSGEISIYWLSGISKKNIINFTLQISLIFLIFYLFLSIFLAPWSSKKGRLILGNSKFTLINSLVKENNFNSPLLGLTVYVNENDKKGNLRGVFIYEKDRTIIATEGRVLTDTEKDYLELYNGTTHEKINKKINTINFEKTVFDFTKYKLQNIYTPKFNERNITWLFDNINKEQRSKIDEIREELNSRLIKPFCILIITILSCLLIYKNEKINAQKFRFLIYIFVIILILLNEVLLGFSGKSIAHTYFYISFIIIIFFKLYWLLTKAIDKK